MSASRWRWCWQRRCARRRRRRSLSRSTYDPLPAVADAAAALQPDAPQLWPEAPGNLAVDYVAPSGDPALAHEIEAAFAAAVHRVRIELVHQRVSHAPMEPRAVTALFEAEDETYVLHAGSQGAGALSGQLAAVLGVTPAKIRVETRDVGGSFGMKTHAYPEYAALLASARLLRPAGALGLDPLRSLHERQSGPRPSRHGRARDGRGRPLPGAAHREHRRAGRLCERGRRAYRLQQFHPLPAGHVCDPAGARPR